MLPTEPFELVELALRRARDVNRHTLAGPAVLAVLIALVVMDLHEEPVTAVVHQVLGVLPRSLPVVAYTAQNLDKRFPPPFAQWERRALGGVAGLYPCSAQAASVAVGKGFTGAVQVLGLPPAPGIGRGDQAPPSTGSELRLLPAVRLVCEKGVLDAVRALVEAPAAVAGYASGSVPEVVGDAGLLVAERDHLALAAAVAGLRAGPDRWSALRERVLERTAYLTWDAVPAGQTELYEAARATGAGPRRVRPGREQAQRRFGPPAEADGVARPFALPLLRDRAPGTVLLERTLDAAARR